MQNTSSRAYGNLAMLEFVARKLGDLKDDVVFLGGCATGILINDPIAPDIRATLDVDCIVDVLSLGQYHQLEKKLVQKGFKRSIEDAVICRWHYDNVILDIMPTDEKILGFGNRWYKSAIKQFITYQMAEDLSIKSVAAPYFLGTKFEAFKTRGNNDYLMSHDFEDIISVIDGRLKLLDEINLADEEIKKYLKNEFSRLLADESFTASLPGHLAYGPSTMARTKIVLDRIKQLADISSE